MEDVATPRTTAVLTDVLSEASRAGMQGWLEKRSGGKHGPGASEAGSRLHGRGVAPDVHPRALPCTSESQTSYVPVG